MPTGDRVERIGRLPGLIQRFVAAENFGEGYALTLREWRRRFLEKWPQVERLGFEAPFRRLWEYYLCYCEAGFRSGMIDVGLYSIQHRRA